MSTLTWRRRVPADASLGYCADGEAHRYVIYRYQSAWLLQVYRLKVVAETKVRSGTPVATDQNDTLDLCKRVADAYEAEPEEGGRRRIYRASATAYAEWAR